MTKTDIDATNWFVALNGKILRRITAEEINARLSAWLSETYRVTHAVELEERMQKYKQDNPSPWSASSHHVPQLTGFGDTPEEAIRDFEDKMRLPGEFPGRTP